MDLNKIQSVLESLPDQDIAKYAQQPSPQVPQVLAQMELQRRATLRQAAQMQNKGGIGMAAGGQVKRYAEGGGILGYLGELTGSMSKKMREVRAKKEQEEAERAKLPPRDNLEGTLLGMGRDALGSTADFTARKNAVLGAPAQPKLDPGIEQLLAAPPTDVQKGGIPPAGTTVPPVAAPGQPPAGAQQRPAQAEPPATEAGLASVAPMPKPMDPNADPRMAQMEAALDQKGDVISKAVAEELALRKNAMVPVDEEKERNRQLYTALGQWGTALLLSRSYGVANATALNTLQEELSKSEEKRKEFKKAALDVALTEIKYRIEQAGAPADKLKELEALRGKIMKENLDVREQERKEKDTASDTKYKGQLGTAAIKNAESSRISAERPRSGADEAITYEKALKQAADELGDDKLGNNMRLKGADREAYIARRAREIMAAQQQILQDKASGRLGAIGAAYPGAPAIPTSTSGIIDFTKLPK